MKPVKILHYVEDSFGYNPSYIILMSDDKEYISNGCIFIECIETNIEYLISKYECKIELEELLSAPGIDNDKLVNGSCMFKGCKDITELSNYPLLEVGNRMYEGCVNIFKPGDYPLLEIGCYMYYWCKNLAEPGVYPLLKDGTYMYLKCKNLTKKGKHPLLQCGYGMYYDCKNIEEQ